MLTNTIEHRLAPIAAAPDLAASVSNVMTS
jgi:hypothetical protein